MADNPTLTARVSGETATIIPATDEVGGAHYQKVKIALGAENAVDNVVDSGQQVMAASVPVVLASDQTDIKITLDGEPVVISGTVQVQSNSANLATQTTAAAIQTAVETIDNAIAGNEMQVDIVTVPAPLSTTGGGTEATALRVTLANDSTGVLSIDDNGGSLTVDGSVTANAGTNLNTSLLALESGGNLAAAVTALQILDNAISGSEMQVDVITVPAPLSTTGGGTEAAALRVTLANDSTGVVSVDDNGGSLTVDGSVTANAGTNLNTSLLALEAGGNLAAAAASLSVVDDWDESDRAKVNLIVGQAGVAAGAGAVGATVQRVTLASDDPAVVALQILDNAISGNEMQVDVITMPTVAVTQSGTWDEVGINDSGNSITVDAPTGTPVNVQIGDGTRQATVRDTGANDSLNVAIVDAAGAQITSFGGGTQYTEGDTDASVTGTAMLWEDTADTLRSVSAAKPLPVNIISGAGSGGTAIQDGAVFTPDTTNLTPIGGYRDDTAPATVTEGDAAAARITEYRALHVNLRDATGAEVSVGGGTQYTEDAAAAANPVGTALMMVREDARAGSLTSTDGDNVAARGNNRGELYVKTTDSDALLTTIDADTSNISTKIDTLAGAVAGTEMQVDVLTVPAPLSTTGGGTEAAALRVTIANDSTGVVSIDDNGGSLTVDGTITANLAAGTNNIGDVDVLSIIPGTGATNLGKAIDTATGATDTGVLILATRDNALSTLTPAEGDNVQLRVNTNGALWTHDDALDAALSGNELQVDIVAALPAGTNNIGDVDILSIAAGDNNIGNVDIVTVPAPLSTTGGGTEATALRVTVASDSTGVLSVDDNGTTLSIDDGAGSITIDGTVTASNTAGDVAHDTADSGNPVKVGGKAYNFDGTVPGTAVVENDRTNFVTDLYGRQYVETTHPNYWTVSADYASAQTNASVRAAPGASLRLYVTDIIISNGATAGNITLLDGSGGTVLVEIYPAINGGMAMPFRTPIPLTANTALVITSTTVTTHSVTVCGYTAAA